jgi:predicted aspartyl protease
MRTAALAVTLAFIAMQPAHAEATCELKAYGTVAFETDETGHIYLPATVAGRSTRLKVDTGAYWSVLRRDLAEAQGLKIGAALYFDLYV